MINKTLSLLFITLIFLIYSSRALAENVDPAGDDSQYAYGENAGWLNFEPNGDGGQGVHVFNDRLDGYIWGENVGWISLSCENTINCGTIDFGVVNDGDGNLSGYAWGENIGWISFSCENTNSCSSIDFGVMIDPQTGEFSGRAWGENIGWITFMDTLPVTYGVKTSWVSSIYLCESDFEPDGDVDGVDMVQEINADGSNIDQFATDFGRTDCPIIY